MAKTLLNGVNDILRLGGEIAGDAGLLTSLTDSARQVAIDNAILALNQTIDELYTTVGIPLPQQQAQSTITLATSTRNYTLATNFIRLHWPLIDKTNSQFIRHYRPGYDEILQLDPEENDTGLPIWGVIRPTDSALYVYPTPTSSDNGKVYTYQYDKDMELTVAADTVPFNNAVYRAVIPAAFQVWKREHRNQFDAELFKTHFGRAARELPQVPVRSSYNPRG